MVVALQGGYARRWGFRLLREAGRSVVHKDTDIAHTLAHTTCETFPTQTHHYLSFGSERCMSKADYWPSLSVGNLSLLAMYGATEWHSEILLTQA